MFPEGIANQRQLVEVEYRDASDRDEPVEHPQISLEGSFINLHKKFTGSETGVFLFSLFKCAVFE